MIIPTSLKYALSALIWDHECDDAFDNLEGEYVSFFFDRMFGLNEQWMKEEVPSLDKEFYFATEYQAFKRAFYSRLQIVDRLYTLFKDRAIKANEGSSEEDSKEWWNDCGEDEYPKSDFPSFQDWYGSKEWSDWNADNSTVSWNDFADENSDMIEALNGLKDVDETYGQIRFWKIDKKLESLQEDIEKIFESLDDKIKKFELSHEKKSQLFYEIFGD